NKPWPQLPPDRQFVMKDMMYVNMTTPPHSFLPQQPSHPNGSGLSAVGGNISFLDGHVEWHALRPGKSWKMADLPVRGGFWTPSFAGPTTHPGFELLTELP
ncbi:MAG: hypothetical protein ACODAQ_04730, partial [Phycisphaeraceae bacterium]